MPFFSPQDFNGENLNQTQQFDIGLSYLFERGRKRQHRLQAARDVTAVTRAQISDAERGLIFNVGQQFISGLLAQSTLQFAQEDLADFQQTVNISQEQFRAGYIGEADFLKIKLQLLQFQTDVSSTRLAKVQALTGLRELLGYDAVPANFDIVGELAYQPVNTKLDDLQSQALRQRPDYRAAELGIVAAKSQIALAKANSKVDVTGTYNFSHVAGESSASLFANVPLPVFDRNQGEIARTRYALTQAEEQERSAGDTVLSDVSNAYEAVRSNDEVVQLYTSGYLQQAKDSREISEYAYKRGAASLLDYLRRSPQLPGYATGLPASIGFLHDSSGTAEAGFGDEEPAMNCNHLRRFGFPLMADCTDRIGVERVRSIHLQRFDKPEERQSSRTVQHTARNRRRTCRSSTSSRPR